jgi:hypothetical protein
MPGKINFKGVKTEFEPIPSGTYENEFISWKFGVTGPGSRNPGEEKVDLAFSVTGDVEGEEEFKNRRFYRTCTFGPDSLWAFKRTMVSLGSEVDWEDSEGVDPDAVCREVHHNKVLLKIQKIEADEEGAYEDPVTHEKKASNRIVDVLPTDSMRLLLAERNQTLPEQEPATGRRHR